jgi:hypothetical protein
MQSLLKLVVLIAILWAIDTFAFDGYYRRAAWQGTQQQGQKFSNEVQRWLNTSWR